MKRRALIFGIGLTASTLIAGCLNSIRDDHPEEGEESRDDNETADGNESRTGNETTDGYESGESDGTRQDSIFIENLTDRGVTIAVRVERKADAERLIDNSYEIPKATGLEIPDVGEVGVEYTITAVYNGENETFDWRVLTCTTDADDSGATDLEIEVSGDGLWVGNNGCDETGAGDRQELTYEHHEDYLEKG